MPRTYLQPDAGGPSKATASRGCMRVRCCGAKSCENLPDQCEGVVGDDDGDGKCHRGVEPIPAARCQDDRAGRSHACRRSGIRDGVQQDCRHGQVMLTGLILILIVIVIAVSTEDESAASHYKRGNATHYEYRQA